MPRDWQQRNVQRGAWAYPQFRSSVIWRICPIRSQWKWPVTSSSASRSQEVRGNGSCVLGQCMFLLGSNGILCLRKAISVSNSVYIAHLSDAELKAWRDRVRQNCAHAMKILSRGASGGSQGRREILNTGGVAVLTKLLR